jgi:hypothetical protein
MGREFREIMVADDVDLRSVVTHQTTKLLEARPSLYIIVGTLGGDLRDGVIVRRQLDPQVVRIPNVEQPPIFLLDRHAAVTEGVAEQRDQQHFGRKPNINRPCLESEPLTRRTTVGLPSRAVGEVRRDISPMNARNVGQFLFRDVDLRLRKVGKPTRMVGVAVRQNDVPHVFGRKSKCFNSANGSIRLIELETRHVDERLA